jgi:hypothetical protein
VVALEEDPLGSGLIGVEGTAGDAAEFRVFDDLHAVLDDGDPSMFSDATVE